VTAWIPANDATPTNLEVVVEKLKTSAKVPGPAPLTAQREEHSRLIARGVSNAEACRLVGINRRTGTRWLYGRSVPARDGTSREYPAVSDIAKQPSPRSTRYLTEEDREVIAERRRAKVSMRVIAQELGRDVSTVSRELARNADANGRYRPLAAQRATILRMARPRVRKVAADPVLAAVVQGWLDVKWSPEQISNSLLTTFPGEPSRQLATESIYQALYAKCSVLQRDPSDCLRSGRRRRLPHRRGDRRRPNPTSGLGARRPIAERSAEATDRKTAGHWEGDLITGRANRSAIATLVDRASGYTILVHLPGSHTAQVTSTALIAAFNQLPEALRQSLTWDCGTEMADHALVTVATGLDIFFADPHSPWQRGSNENTNGLLRQYFPKGTDLSIHPVERLDEVQAELNARPRKRHQWATPAARLATLNSPHK
jgi:IS30 family transposase